MANHSSTKKAIRKTITKTALNKSRKTRIRTYLKRVIVAVESGLVEEANNALVEAQSEIMKGVTHNIINKNTAARRISRLNKKIKAIATTPSPLKKKSDLKNKADEKGTKTQAKAVKVSKAKVDSAVKKKEVSDKAVATVKKATPKKDKETVTKKTALKQEQGGLTKKSVSKKD